jgi:AraC family transcriptional regulator
MGTELPEGAEAAEGLITLYVPAQTCAVFEGPEIQNVWRRIYSEWFPSAGFEQVEGPCLEKYFWADDAREEAICEVWIPVRKKAV